MKLLRLLTLLFRNPWMWRRSEDWTNEDATALAAFLATRTGLKFAILLRNASVEANANAVANSSAHLNGTAAGVMAAIRYIESLSRPVPAQEDRNGEAGEQAADILDHLRP
jgi:hypothetical protein